MWFFPIYLFAFQRVVLCFPFFLLIHIKRKHSYMNNDDIFLWPWSIHWKKKDQWIQNKNSRKKKVYIKNNHRTFWMTRRDHYLSSILYISVRFIYMLMHTHEHTQIYVKIKSTLEKGKWKINEYHTFHWSQNISNNKNMIQNKIL